jgi:hypothetical protein
MSAVRAEIVEMRKSGKYRVLAGVFFGDAAKYLYEYPTVLNAEEWETAWAFLETMKKEKWLIQEILWEDLSGKLVNLNDPSFSLRDWRKAIEKLGRRYGENAILKTNAGHNNVCMEIEEGPLEALGLESSPELMD